MREFRRDPIIGRWVIISSERARRPYAFVKYEREIDSPDTCPFCWGNEKFTPPEIVAYRPSSTKKDTPGWWIRVIPNKYPALRVEGNVVKSADGIYDKITGIGAHEVIIETQHHNKDIYELDQRNVEDIFKMYKDRVTDLKRDIRFEYILIFKNCGTKAGATLSHPHSQLIAMPMIPVIIKQEITGAKFYFEHKERCIYCDIVSEELTRTVRVVVENDDFIAICPYASRFPFEIWVLPKRHDPMYEDIHDNEIRNLASIMQVVNKKLNLALENPPYNYLLHTSPLKDGNLQYYHWHIEIMPQLSGVGGFEWGTGFYINPVPPEEAAKFLREI
ncbi:MAG: galactose-1-phosphate uridylyltransferase [Endomicrobia bacterium]|nr:galactose-1-phosphate uridylyltransferase [Endomicrobiia bacterium]MCX7941058.1 galactose-1-phosphate uridylyltransferase [Endomicrobiia bacterium]MDW8055360.1 galactose-1-phosphate uridylyltransferase [Elusimicrobiota bacterium]